MENYPSIIPFPPSYLEHCPLEGEPSFLAELPVKLFEVILERKILSYNHMNILYFFHYKIEFFFSFQNNLKGLDLSYKTDLEGLDLSYKTDLDLSD